MSEIKYKRVLLKLSGEMLGGQEKRGIDISVLDEISNQIKRMLEAKAEVAIVIGAGNFWRGKKEDEIERTTSDYIGMLGTTMNGLALQSRLQKNGIDAILQTAIKMEPVAEQFSRRRAVEYLEENPTVNCVVTGGMGDKDTPSEAEVMYDYLVQKGISPKRIEKDASSRNTKENLENAKQIIQSKGWNQNIAIITEYYHEFRAGRLADELGMRSYAVCAETPWYIFSSSYGREVLALTKFFCHI